MSQGQKWRHPVTITFVHVSDLGHVPKLVHVEIQMVCVSFSFTCHKTIRTYCIFGTCFNVLRHVPNIRMSQIYIHQFQPIPTCSNIYVRFATCSRDLRHVSRKFDLHVIIAFRHVANIGIWNLF